MSLPDRAAELHEIELFLARRGPTRCRSAFADALSPREEQDRIAAFRVRRLTSQRGLPAGEAVAVDANTAMSARRAANRRPLDDTRIYPTPERGQHGKIEILPHVSPTTRAGPSRPFRALDSLAVLWRHDVISGEMFAAGSQFRADFRRAKLDGLKASDLNRIPGNIGRGFTVTESSVRARERVFLAINALGGPFSPGGSVTWHIVALEWSIKRWALERGWNDRKTDQREAHGVLIGALGILRKFYRL